MILLLNPISTPITLSLLSLKGKIIYRQKLAPNKNLNDEIIPKIDNLLHKANIKKTQLTKVICLIGPGSYTKLRLFLSIANMFGYLLKISLYGFTLYDLEIFSFLSNYSYSKHKQIVAVCLKSKYSKLTKEFLITKGKKTYIINSFKKNPKNKDWANKDKATLVLDYSKGYLTVDKHTTDYLKTKFCLVKQAENFVKQIILQKSPFEFKHIKSKNKLLPVYYAPAGITKRKFIK